MTRTVSRLLRLLACVLAGALLWPVPGAHAAKTCYDCHQQQKKDYGARKFVHDPVGKEQCESCHGRHGFAQNLVLKFNDNQLCYSCHQDLQTKFDSGAVHLPVKAGVCWDCHDPHASDKKGLLYPVPEGTDDPSSCLLCHDSEIGAALKAAHPHKPFNDLTCMVCHEAHNSEHAPLLKQEGDALCLNCHQKDAQAMATAHTGKHAESLHCLDCHSGHATSKPGLVSARAHTPFADGDCETCHSMPDASNQVTFSGGATPNSICGGCHEEQAQAPSRSTPHPAVTSDNCSDCHLPHSSRQGKLLVKAEGEMCQECHSDLLADSSLAKHDPAVSGQCGACHEPHGSDQPHLLRRTGSDLCLECHTAMAAAKDSSASVHAALDDCLSCHSPHEGVGPKLLRKPAEQLCAECHQPDPKALTAASSHPPYVTGDCAGCHDPHFSRQKALLKASGPGLCTGCHAETGTQLNLAAKHPPAGEDCLTCHTAHYSEQASLLAEAPKTLCLSCHDPADLGLQKDHVHTAAAEGDCIGCHNPHGADRAGLMAGRAVRMVVNGQTVIVRPEITDQRASLCYTCHQEMGDAIQKNVAHAPAKEGRCEVCHTEHGSDQPGFVKAPAPELCVGCHTVDTLLNAAHQGFNVAKADCLDCHNPHLSTAAKLVRPVSHPPFAEGACDLCHEKGPDGSVVAPADVSEVCATCHDGLGEDKNLAVQHPPFEGGECVACHRVHAADEEKLLRAKDGQLCFQCHGDLRKLDTLASVHPPFGDQKCMDCHRPHASANAGLLNKPAESFCLQCHTALGEALAKGQVHAPVKSGRCLACHEKHAGTQPALLLSEKASLCGTCHNLTTAAMNTAHHGFDLAGADCQSCHEPHVSPKGGRGLLLPDRHKPFAQGQCSECHEGTSTQVTAGLQLCSKCHADAVALTSKPVVHPALALADSCGGCHSPHVGFGSGLQKHEGPKQCLTCHNTKAFTGPVKHPPAYEDCGTCHDPHSSDNKKLLSTPDVLELCLTCHEDAQKTHFHPMGPGITDPRTRKDLVCTGCHSPHSTTEPQLLLADKNRQLCNVCHGTSHE